MYDPANLLVGVYVGKTKSEREVAQSCPTLSDPMDYSPPGPPSMGFSRQDACTPMFPAALFAIAKTRKQPKFPSADDWLNKLWHMYTVKYYSVI